MPQDEYDCSRILDDWLVDMKIDLVYSVLKDCWDIIYPKFQKVGTLQFGYTSYIPDDWVLKWANPKSYEDREIDVSYRAKHLPENFGRLGQLKYLIAEKFKNSIKEKNIKVDISTDDKHTIPGTEWHAFLENSKACLVTPSGSSLIDFDNSIRTKILNFKSKSGLVSFETVEKHCFPGEDGKLVLSAISPRNIEAALSETLQIATPGKYSDILIPNVHYVEIDEDCSNVDRVISILKNVSKAKKIIKNCKKQILSIPRLRQTVIIEEFITFLEITAVKIFVKNPLLKFFFGSSSNHNRNSFL